MATKKKTKKKKSKTAGKSKSAQTLKKKCPPKKAAAKTAPKKKSRRKAPRASKKPARGKREDINTIAISPGGMGARSGGQSGSLQGLSDTESADSESVDELIEEGNAFEAEVVEGVESAPDPDESEVHTHEVPEDDVPDEYEEQ